LVINFLTDEQRAEIDTRILAGDIIVSIRLIMVACGVGLRAAADINRTRYQQLRVERPAEFARSDEEYWSGYSECPFDAMTRDL
jgi:hypothetical protein